MRNEEFGKLHTLPNIRMIKSRRWEGQVTRMGEKRHVYRVVVCKLEGNIPLGRLRRKWEVNIKMGF